MRMKVIGASLALALPAVLLGATPTAEFSRENVAKVSCDRRCVLTHLTGVLDAIGENTPQQVALSPKVKITSNGAPTQLSGSAVWGPARRIPYRLTFADPVTGSAVFFGVVTNYFDPPPADQSANLPRPPPPPGAGDSWWFYALRIKVVDNSITEVEQIAYEPQKGFGDKQIREMHLADRVWETPLPKSEQVSRDELMRAADLYFDGISKRVDTSKVPWHPSCQRVESGMYTTDASIVPASCGSGMKAVRFHWDVESRRYYIADVERGVVVAAANFMIPPDAPKGFISGLVMEAFKVESGLLRHIDAYSRIQPNQQKSGWGTGPGS